MARPGSGARTGAAQDDQPRHPGHVAGWRARPGWAARPFHREPDDLAAFTASTQQAFLLARIPAI